MSHSTTFAPERRAVARAAFVVAALLVLAACGPTTVVVQGNFPRPLLEPLPLRMGVLYREEFANHEFFDEARGRAESSWIVQTGAAQVEMWDILLDGMFEELVHVTAEPAPERDNAPVDAVLIPHVDELQYTIPTHTNIKVYEIWMRYRFELVSAAGNPLAEWTMTAYGKTPTAFLRSDQEAVNLAAVVALRDAGANFATSFTRVPEVQQWMQSRVGPGPEKGS